MNFLSQHYIFALTDTKSRQPETTSQRSALRYNINNFNTGNNTGLSKFRYIDPSLHASLNI